MSKKYFNEITNFIGAKLKDGHVISKGRKVDGTSANNYLDHKDNKKYFFIYTNDTSKLCI